MAVEFELLQSLRNRCWCLCRLDGDRMARVSPCVTRWG